MIIENNKKEIKFLKSLGFKKDGFDDGSSFWYTKKIKHFILGKCLIHVQDFQGEAIISVDTKDKDENRFYVSITENIPYDRENLLKVLGFLI